MYKCRVNQSNSACGAKKNSDQASHTCTCTCNILLKLFRRYQKDYEIPLNRTTFVKK